MKGIQKNTLFAFIIFGLMTQMIIKCDLNPDNVIAAINCGGEAYKDSKGVIYEKVKN
jgi:hypothetical protein